MRFVSYLEKITTHSSLHLQFTAFNIYSVYNYNDSFGKHCLQNSSCSQFTVLKNLVHNLSCSQFTAFIIYYVYRSQRLQFSVFTIQRVHNSSRLNFFASTIYRVLNSSHLQVTSYTIHLVRKSVSLKFK